VMRCRQTTHGLFNPEPTQTGAASRIHSRPFLKPATTNSAMDGCSVDPSISEDPADTVTQIAYTQRANTKAPSRGALLPLLRGPA